MDAESEAIALSRNLNTLSPPAIHELTSGDKLAYRHEFFLNLLKVGISFVSIGAHNFILDVKSLSLPEKESFFYQRKFAIQ